jgi:hypothetical protein
MTRPWEWLATLVVLTGIAGADEPPYTAEITSDDVYVRSGPGKTYYPTDRLRKGERVEVYRQDPGGWLAIRPPRDSFSWVSARHLETLPGSLAKVTGDQVVARVGSRLSEHRDVIQVRLDKNETVELLEDPSSGDPAWRQIAPPSGEFRWISAKFVQPVAALRPAPVEAPIAAQGGLLTQRERGWPAEASRPSRFPAADGGREVFQPARRPAPRRPVRRAEYLEPADEEADASVTPAAGWREVERGAGDGSLRGPLEDLDIELSTMLAGDPSQWSFDELAFRCQELLATAQTPIDRGRARLMLRKITRYQELQARQTEGLTLWPRASRPTVAGGPHGSRVVDPPLERFDGVGTLRPVAPRRAGDPPFALVDERGEVRAYLVPAPGVALARWQGQRVGVVGQRSMPAAGTAPWIQVRQAQGLADPLARLARTAASFGQVQ